MGKEQEFLTQLKWYAYWQLNQGYALQVKPPKYELLILVELHKIERFSSQYEQELKCLSRCIRRYIWKEENEDNLWCYLKIINIVFEESEKAAAIDDFWGLGRIITYTKCLCACCGELKTDKREVLNKIIDSIQIANAKVALEERWKNIRSSPDGDKAFIDIFQDIFENAITKYETDFICSLDETDILYRMVKEKICDEGRFIPWPNKVQNRWNPPGKTYLYLSYEFGNTFYDTFWKNIQEAYESSGYMELSKYIYNLFEMDIEEKIVERTFGVVPITIEKKTYFFVLLNTSWCCIDENDTRKIVLGKFQLDKISEEAIKLRRNIEPSLSICLGHHPLQCLEGNEETTALMELTDSSRIMANAYLCGHTHNRTVVNWNNNVRTLNTFMTGIGQGDAENDRVRAQHTRKRLYAFYVFNIELNSVDIYSYGTNAEGNFKPDFDLYTKNIEENQKKIVFPINMQKTMPYIWLTGGPNSTGKACYLSDELLDRFQEYEIRMSNFRKEMCDLLWRTRVLYFDDGIDESKIKTIIEIWEKEQEKTKEKTKEEQEITVDGILYAHLMLEKSVQGQQLMEELVGLDKGKNSRVFDDFYAYLTQICAILRNNLVDEEKKTLVRFHFRFRLKDKMYSQLCISIPPECKPETMNMQPMQYDDLLKASYDVGHSLIYSVNKSLVHTEPKKRWKNFITAIPSFDGNKYRKNRREHGKGIPFITFGVSVGSSDLNSLLYYMDFHSIERTLADVIEDYLEYFPIDMKAFCEWARENVEYTSDEGGV